MRGKTISKWLWVAGAETFRIGFTCWVGNSCVEADEKENQLKQKLEVAQVAGWDSFHGPKDSLTAWTYLNILEPYYWNINGKNVFAASMNITCLNNYTIIRHLFLQDGNWIMTPNPKWENSLTQDHPTLQIWLVQHFLRWSSLKEAHCQHNRSPKDKMQIIFLQYVMWV